MLYCANCLKMVEFNSTAVSSPKSAVTFDMEGDFDPSIISSKTKIFNVCKECGQHEHLYQSKEEAFVVRMRQSADAQRQFDLGGSITGGGIIFAIMGIVVYLMFWYDDENFGASLFHAICFGGGAGALVGVVLGALYQKRCEEGISFNKKHLTLIGVFAGCFLVFKWYQSGEKEQLVVRTLNLIDRRNFQYTKNPNYELQKDVGILSPREVEELTTLVSLSKDGDPRAEVAVGYYREIAGYYVRAYELYEKAANKGSSRGMFRLGVMNLEGLGLDNERPDVAAEWFSQSGVNEAESIVSRREAIK